VGADNDPERLIAEALRAQAARTPLPTRDAGPVQPAGSLPLASRGYGLLSGSDVHLADHSADRDETTGAVASATEATAPVRRTSVTLILLFAALLGLAAGAVVGLVTLL
jgi:hypothetical protein